MLAILLLDVKMQGLSRCPATTAFPWCPRGSNQAYASSAYLTPPPPELPRGLLNFGAIKSECFLWCRCPSRAASWSTNASDIILFVDRCIHTLTVKFRSNQCIFNVLVSFQGPKRLFSPDLFEYVITF